MVNTLSAKEFESLVEQTGDVCISIYMPTHPTHLEQQREDIVRLRRLLERTELTLAEISPALRTPDIQQLLEPAYRLLHEESDIWKQAGTGTAIFLAPGFARIYRLPLDVEELSITGTCFYIKPLLPLLTENDAFYILALSQKAIRLLQADQYHTQEVPLKDVSHSLAETLQWDEFERELQWHSGGAPGAPGRRVAMFHGHGMGTEERHKEQVQRFLQEVAEGVDRALANQQDPLIVAGVEYIVAIYRQVNRYPHLAEPIIAGNPDNFSADALRAEAWARLQPQREAARTEALARYQQLAHTREASDYVREIVTAAHQGRVDTLLVAVAQQQWGYHDPQTGYLHLYESVEPGSEDLLNLAAIYTMRNGGSIVTVDATNAPSASGLAAIFRY